MPLDRLMSHQSNDTLLELALKGDRFLLFDGAMGTQLIKYGFSSKAKIPELLPIYEPDKITSIHKSYAEAGADVVTSCTFGANRLKLEGMASVNEIYKAAYDCARKSGAAYVAADIGPIGSLLEPMGNMAFDEAYDIFSEQARAIDKCGYDIVLIETITDLLEAKAALLAAKENTDLPVFVTMAFDDKGRTFLGTPPEIAAEVLSSMGAEAVGLNCSLGPEQMMPLAASFAARSRCPIMAQPNAGLPRIESGQTVYDVSPEKFASYASKMLESGVSIIGGCCGTSPEFIASLRSVLDEVGKPYKRPYEPATVVTSAERACILKSGDRDIAIVGERINPTGNKKISDALKAGDYGFFASSAIEQDSSGADMVDVNVGLAGMDEASALHKAVFEIQAASTIPLVLDTGDGKALERAVRSYAGKPLINSVNGKRESLEQILPIASKYGCSLIGLTLDEDGIPQTAEKRLEIACRIVNSAEIAGIPREDIVIDCLAMTVSTNQEEAIEILKSLSLIHDHLGVRTVLGVSNISFGLPERPVFNSYFLASAFASGLDIAIINPCDMHMKDAVDTYKVINGQDPSASNYVERHAVLRRCERPTSKAAGATFRLAMDEFSAGIILPDVTQDVLESIRNLAAMMLSGIKDGVEAYTESILECADPIDIINLVLVPVLDEVGRRYDCGETFLPQMMSSAEAVKASFDVIRRSQVDVDNDCSPSSKGAIAVATVKGDVHDIGKNIVAMLLENYGFKVCDLGKDVAPEVIAEAVRENGIRLLGLSALMTTTLGAMERTVEVVNSVSPETKIMVGGAVLTEEYAKKIGADFYAKDAAASARIARQVFES